MSKPLFSILHSTARPEGWQAAYLEWIEKAVNREAYEYVLCVDKRWGFVSTDVSQSCLERGFPGPPDRVIWNEGPKTAVSGWNTAAAAARGDILLVVADDFFPCDGWDVYLQGVVDAWKSGHGYRKPLQFAIRVSMGVPEADKQGHMCHAFLSRARYEHQGSFVYHPEYEGVFCDNDFTAHAEQDGVIIEARHLVFPHRNPFYKHGPGGMDEAWWHHNKPQDYAFGKAVFDKRKAECFGHVDLVASRKVPMAAGLAVSAVAGSKKPQTDDTGNGHRGSVPNPLAGDFGAPSRILAFCLPGERFESDWVAGLVPLLFHATGLGFAIQVHFAYTSNVFVTRADLLEAVLQSDPKPDLVLWLDDDNILTPAQFDTLLSDLEARPEADGVTGWCWIQFEREKRFVPSCGDFMPDGVHLKPLEATSIELQAELREIEWTGFPAFLMRYGALVKAGERPFLPVLDSRLKYGLSGEDAAFCKVALAGGARFFVDPRVRVPHLKWRAIEPEWAVNASEKSESVSEPVIVGMIRAKNEARYIARAVKSLLTVCRSVYVMDDGSTDDTRLIAEMAGAWVLPSPFSIGPDEARDKAWLVDYILKAIAPVDWLLCIDGDEELAPGSAEKIRAAVRVERVHGVSCYALRFWHLWDRADQIRVDRWYSNFSRRCLFRPLPGFSFRSLYAGSGVNVHGGLHTGNGPADLPAALLEGVRLIHWGYMNRADRIRKFEWYNRLDPNNPLEDGYRHCVQGDIPEVPADAVLMHAGPLQLAPLPVGLVGIRGAYGGYDAGPGMSEPYGKPEVTV